MTHVSLTPSVVPAKRLGEASAVPQDALSAEPPAPFRFEAGRAYAIDGAELPERCAVCGDSFELSAYRTVPGRIRYHVCREHVVAAASKLVVGLVMILVSAYQLVDPILSGEHLGRAAKVGFGSIFVGGVVLAILAIPVHAGPSRGGMRRVWGAAKALRSLDLNDSK